MRSITSLDSSLASRSSPECDSGTGKRNLTNIVESYCYHEYNSA